MSRWKFARGVEERRRIGRRIANQENGKFNLDPDPMLHDQT